jgi:hypothetical protein
MTKVSKIKNLSLLDKFSQTEAEFLKQHALDQSTIASASHTVTVTSKNQLQELEADTKNKSLELSAKEEEIAQSMRAIEEKLHLIENQTKEISNAEESIREKEELLAAIQENLLLKEAQLKKAKIPLPASFQRFAHYAQNHVGIDRIFIDNPFTLSDEQAKRINLSLSVAVEFSAINLDSQIEQVTVKFESPTRFSINIDIQKTWSYILKVSPSGDFLLQKFNRAVKSWNAEYSMLSKEFTKNHIHGYQFDFNFDHATKFTGHRKIGKVSAKKTFRITKTPQYDI